jgi:hypothetical protein
VFSSVGRAFDCSGKLFGNQMVFGSIPKTRIIFL